MDSAFLGAKLFDSNLGALETSKVTSFSKMFKDTAAFKGEGLNKWSLAALTSGGFDLTFDNAAGLISCTFHEVLLILTTSTTVNVCSLASLPLPVLPHVSYPSSAPSFFSLLYRRQEKDRGRMEEW